MPCAPPPRVPIASNVAAATPYAPPPSCIARRTGPLPPCRPQRLQLPRRFASHKRRRLATCALTPLAKSSRRRRPRIRSQECRIRPQRCRIWLSAPRSFEASSLPWLRPNYHKHEMDGDEPVPIIDFAKV
uniref:Uncharacterized protein n=1 Tax=Leersia perrieri TaxID=77586 RepID=A0A0D9W943_9ORYZ